MSLVFALILTVVLFLTAVASPSPPSPPSDDCVADLAAFSPCFAYVSVRPNKVHYRVNRQCCRVVSEAFTSGGSNCFCHLMKQPLLSGFPLNRTRIASLPSLCSHWSKNASSSMKNFGSMKSICTAVPPSVPSLKGSLGVPTSPHPAPESGDDTSDIMGPRPPTESPSPSVAAPHNRTLAPANPPAASSKPSSASSATSPRLLPHHPHALSPPASSIAAKLSFSSTWTSRGVAFCLALSLAL